MNISPDMASLNRQLIKAQQDLDTFNAPKETEDETVTALLELTGRVDDLQKRIDECRKIAISEQKPPSKTPEERSRKETEPAAGVLVIENLLDCSEKLPKLTQEQREATFGDSLNYSNWFRLHARDFHANGDQWPDEKLQKFFSEGLKNHYFAESLKKYLIDPSYNFAQFLDPKEQRALINNNFFFCNFRKQFISIAKNLGIPTQGVSNEELVRTIVPIAVRLVLLIQEVEFPNELIQLGGLFQKKKVCVEKAADELSELGAAPDDRAEKLQTLLLKADREAEQAQQIIYYWIDECARQLQVFAMRIVQDPAVDPSSFSFQRPEFLMQ